MNLLSAGNLLFLTILSRTDDDDGNNPVEETAEEDDVHQVKQILLEQVIEGQAGDLPIESSFGRSQGSDSVCLRSAWPSSLKMATINGN